MIQALDGVRAALDDAGMLEPILAKQADMNELADECRAAGLSDAQIGAFVLERFMNGLAPTTEESETQMRSLALAVTAHFFDRRNATPR